MTESSNLLEPTTVAAYTQAIIAALEAAGVDSQEVLHQAHFDHVRGNDPMLRITDSDINAIYASAVAATDDPYFGLKVAQFIVPGMLHALGYALLASETLEDFCQRVVRYWTLVSRSGDNFTRVTDNQLELWAVPHDPQLCYETQDVWAGLVMRLMRGAHPHPLNPLRLELRRPAPAGGDGPFVEFFGCPVEFDSDRTCFYFDLEVMREPLPGANRELAQYNDQIVIGYLEKLDRDDIVNRVRMHIVKGLSAEAFSRPQIADKLHMSPSTLQVKLARRGVSFQQLLDDTRHELALGYISQSRLAITEIAFMLGFSDLSNFIRAFKRWTGKTPTEFKSSNP